MDDNISGYLTVRGYPMTDTSKIMAALVIRLGGNVHLTPTEYEAAQGLVIWKEGDGIEIEANTDATVGFDELNAKTIE